MYDKANSLCKIFADESKLYKDIESQADQQDLQNDLSTLCDWNEKWLLKYSTKMQSCSVWSN